jgi:hypothetical protein
MAITEETRQKLRDSHKGQVGTWKGKHLPEDMKKRISEKLKGTISPKRGIKLSEETKKKISDAKKGCKPTTLGRRKENAVTRQPGYYYHQHLLREFRENGNGGSHTIGEWETLKSQYNWVCPSCGRAEPDISLTRDHIIPVSKGGSNNIENIQPLCLSCNVSKKTKVIKYNVIQTENRGT